MEKENQDNTIAYDGQCAFAVSIGKTDVRGKKHQLEIDGKTYFFSNPVAKILLKLLPNRLIKADAHWKNGQYEKKNKNYLRNPASIGSVVVVFAKVKRVTPLS